ncbi:hepatoma-derived growth factor-related protein 3-like [Artemia franciscana]|uniref:hepatoma-derived growth factor-related protein 3-like n=1 Tax=Artemia franciscana TaxID=6661 RepID=UPI0032D9CA30
MVQFQKGDLAVAQLKGYPLWPVRIVSITNREKSTPKFVVFCYGSHDFQTVMEANLLSYDIKRLKTSESTTKGVNHAYRECASSPDIYFQFHKKQATNSPSTD